MLIGLAVISTAGKPPPSSMTLTVVWLEAVPPGPEQFILKTVVWLRLIVSFPEMFLAPNQPSPWAMQEVALVVFQVRIELSPRLIVEGLAIKVSVGPLTTN